MQNGTDAGKKPVPFWLTRPEFHCVKNRIDVARLKRRFQGVPKAKRSRSKATTPSGTADLT